MKKISYKILIPINLVLIAVCILKINQSKQTTEDDNQDKICQNRDVKQAPLKTDQKEISAKIIKKENAFKELIIKKLQKRMKNTNYEYQLTKVGTTLYPKFSNHIQFEHYKVVIKESHNHMQSSFDALIDPSNGNIIKTWNKTQFEHPKRISLKIEGREYNPL